MMQLPNLDTLTLIAATGAVLMIVWRWHRDPANPFDITDLITDAAGKVSLFRTGQLVALLVSTWGFVVLTRAEKLSEFYFVGYMAAWSGANLISKALEAKAQPKDTP